MRFKGFQLSKLAVAYIEFIGNLLEDRVISVKDSLDLVTQDFNNVSMDARRVILPLNEEYFSVIYNNIKNGRRLIEIYRNDHGERYVVGSPFCPPNNNNGNSHYRQ